MMSDPQTITIELPELYPLQHQAIFCEERYGVIEASTKAGKTVGCLVWQINEALSKVGNHWWVAPVSSQARIAFERAKAMVPREIYETNESRLEISLINGSVWAFKSADKPDSLYGEDVLSAVIDEASRVKEKSWYAVRSTLTATRGPIRIIGNVKGRGNWFYKIARKAQQGARDHRYTKITAQDAVDAGVLAKEEIEAAERDLPKHVFRELYLAEAADDGGNPFGLSSIDACIAPISTSDPFVWGWDLAKSHDWTVGIALDRDGAVCRFERWQGAKWDVTAQKIGNLTAGSPALIDATGVGDPVYEQVAKLNRKADPFVFTSKSKQQIMEWLASAIASGDIKYPDNEIKDELDVFEYEYTRSGVKYSAPSGLHDDCVCALALAWFHYKNTPQSVAKTRSGGVPFRHKINAW